MLQQKAIVRLEFLFVRPLAVCLQGQAATTSQTASQPAHVRKRKAGIVSGATSTRCSSATIAGRKNPSAVAVCLSRIPAALFRSGVDPYLTRAKIDRRTAGFQIAGTSEGLTKADSICSRSYRFACLASLIMQSTSPGSLTQLADNMFWPKLRLCLC